MSSQHDRPTNPAQTLQRREELHAKLTKLLEGIRLWQLFLAWQACSRRDGHSNQGHGG
jgi:hypothetical protein